MDIERARELGRAALANLEAHRRRLDDLNVYPVPDGDTGTNLMLTARAVVESLEHSVAASAEELGTELTRAALLGARGNSGVIFSQIVRGFAEGLDGTETAGLARAFRSASDAAYRAVREPVEGTILTVARELAEEGERPDVVALEATEFLRRLVIRGEDAVARTPELLTVLREAGVVDAGGAGLLEIVRGLALAVAGEPLPPAPTAGDLALEVTHQGFSRFRYCTTFVIEGEALDATELEHELERIGDSLLVVGDPTALKVHVHTDDPGSALGLGTRVGIVEGVEIANMHRQTLQREERLVLRATATVEASVAVVAVAPGSGNRELFESLGATHVIEGGQTMNPSTAEILDAIEAAPAAEVIVLPNNSNVLLSAEHAVGLASKSARVVPSRSVQAGVAAITRFMSTASADENEATMRDALADISTGEVTRASRDVEIDGIVVRAGAWLGLADDRAVICDDNFQAVAEEVVDRILDGRRDTLMLLTGEAEPELTMLVEWVHERYGFDAEVHAGGQPHYALLLLAE